MLVDNLMITLAGGKTFPVEQSLIDQYESTYPNIDVKQSLKECAAWNQANPTRRKTAGGIKRHINSWLSKANQDQGAGVTSQPTKLKGPPMWHDIAGAYFRPLKPAEIHIWEYEFEQGGMLCNKPTNEEIIAAIRQIVADPQGKPAYLDAWMLIKAIRSARKAAQADNLSQADIQAYVDSINAEKDLLTRWDMICDHANPMKIEAALNQANIAFARPSTAIQAAQNAANQVKFRLI